MARGWTKGRTCDVEGCTRKHYGKGLCEMHYQRQRHHGDTDLMDRRIPAPVRFERFVDRSGSGGCWIWLGTINQRGYGMFDPGVRVDGGPKMVSAHRWSYEHHVGPIPAGMQIDHLCHVDCIGGVECRHRRCVNPEHLEPVTGRENVLRGNRARGVVPTEKSIRTMAARKAKLS